MKLGVHSRGGDHNHKDPISGSGTGLLILDSNEALPALNGSLGRSCFGEAEPKP